jgi:hypothetical protein
MGHRDSSWGARMPRILASCRASASGLRLTGSNRFPGSLSLPRVAHVPRLRLPDGRSARPVATAFQLAYPAISIAGMRRVLKPLAIVQFS